MNLIDKATKWKRRNKPFIWSWLVLFAVDIVVALIILIAYSREEHIKIHTPEILQKNQALLMVCSTCTTLPTYSYAVQGWRQRHFSGD